MTDAVGGEEARRIRNRYELAARWADDLAHEIKNPFHSMVINLELVKRRAGDPDGVKERAGVVESELHRVHGLIDALLTLLRPWPDTPTADVDRVFDALLPVFRARTRLHQIEYSHEPGGGVAAMPPGELALVLVNLMDNAVDALPKEGRLTTRCSGDDAAARIEVVDDGPGLDGVPGDPFAEGYTTRAGRPGLGLTVCRRLVEAAGGSIEIQDHAQGPGTTVVVTVPRSPSA